MKTITITQTRSSIKRPLSQKRTLESLGLRKLNQTVEHNATPQILGMVNKVKHLLRIEDK